MIIRWPCGEPVIPVPWLDGGRTILPRNWGLDHEASKMGSDTEKKVSWVCFILIKETETQKTSLPVPPMNTDKTTSDTSPT